MRPRRDVFALDYLVETLEFYERAVAGASDAEAVDSGELAWARDVLTQYFSAVDARHPRVAAAWARFEASKARFPVQAADTGVPRKVPYARVHGTRSAAD